MLLHNKARIDNVVFTCAVLHNMLIEHDKWEDEDDDYDIAEDIAKDIPELRMDPRIVNLRKGPVDSSYVGGGNIAHEDVEVESEWQKLRNNLIQHYTYCFKMCHIHW